ncbi:MAG: Crp/Fnr family transcriptional regulator [Bacteroidota bacterium]
MHDQLKEELSKYAQLTDEEWEFVKARFFYQEVKKGSFFLQEGQTCRKMGFVVIGLLRTYSTNEQGDELTTHFAHTHSYAVSFYSLKNQMPSFENIKAVEDTQLLIIDYSDLQDLFSSFPKWEAIHRKIIENAYACLEERNYILQTMSASKKYELLIQKAHPDIIQKAQLGHIASYLGIKQETLSRIRKSLAQPIF